MHTRYDDDFVEGAVFLCASGRRADIPPLQIRRFHAEREKCYAALDPDERNAVFFKLHLAWFREWGLERALQDLLAEFPLLTDALNILAWRKARTKSDEGAELYVNTETGRNAVVAMRAERFERNELLGPFLRHEFTHLSDMVDPSFSYSPDLPLHGPVPTPQRLVRERYRLLWDITIDGRQGRAGREVQTPHARHEALFDRAYTFWPEDQRRAIFGELWTSAAPKHARLLALASDPRDLAHARGALPGSPCPLCGFSTFEWMEMPALSESMRATVQTHFPHWTPEQGACKRCVETYEIAGKFELPSTVCL